LKKADIVEKQILASTDNRNSVMATSTFNKEGNKNLEKHKRLPPKVRSMSGASIDSNVSLLEEGVGIFTSTTNGRSIRYKRTLRLKSEDLKDLNLQYGSNNARFSISTSLQ
jgi:phosphatidate phosphatase PAH1